MISHQRLHRKNDSTRAWRYVDTNLQPDTVGDVSDDPDSDEFRSYILHAQHEPVPVALVNRKPRGCMSFFRSLHWKKAE